VLRNREHLAAIKPVGRALVLNQMRFPSDLRSPAQLHFPDEKLAEKKEIDMALQLVEQLTQSFIPEDFHDTYTEELEKVIEAKIHGRKPKVKGKAPARTESKDLMAALKASLEQEQKRTTTR
jgi:DNA end-binding protein Ku